MSNKQNVSFRTIEDFGNQWKRYPANEGYYSSIELFKDYCGPLITPKEIRGKDVLEIGSGTGRIVNMLLALGANHVYAVEPSQSFTILKKNTIKNQKQITYLNTSGEMIPEMKVDLALSFGVLHHIPHPKPVVDRVYEVLPRGGKFIIWLYGREGNEAYLRIFQPVRAITRILPDFLLSIFADVLNIAAAAYIMLCAISNLPQKAYMLNVFQKLDWNSRKMVIFDQLNPAYAKYYKKNEAENLLRSSTFNKVKIYHRHNYSWTCIGKK